jgi:hypothetical protein
MNKIAFPLKLSSTGPGVATLQDALQHLLFNGGIPFDDPAQRIKPGSAPQPIPDTHVRAPPDGIYDFAFVAARPAGPAAPVVSPIRVREAFGPIHLIGVRVHASHNFKEVLVARATT